VILKGKDIQKVLPHRDPFLFIDSVESMNEASILAHREVTGKEDFFKGHYPHRPIMPGVLLCECIFQAGAIFLAHSMKLEDNASTATPVVTRISNVKFRSPVEPGDKLVIVANLKEVVSGVYFMSGTIKKDGKRIVSLEFSCTLMEESP
jgi:3-hydroxyacyl-[acyl-carrier-protein] dehydratase